MPLISTALRVHGDTYHTAQATSRCAEYPAINDLIGSNLNIVDNGSGTSERTAVYMDIYAGASGAGYCVISANIPVNPNTNATSINFVIGAVSNAWETGKNSYVRVGASEDWETPGQSVGGFGIQSINDVWTLFISDGSTIVTAAIPDPVAGEQYTINSFPDSVVLYKNGVYVATVIGSHDATSLTIGSCAHVDAAQTAPTNIQHNYFGFRIYY